MIFCCLHAKGWCMSFLAYSVIYPISTKRRSAWSSCHTWTRIAYRKSAFPWVHGFVLYRKLKCVSVRKTLIYISCEMIFMSFEKQQYFFVIIYMYTGGSDPRHQFNSLWPSDAIRRQGTESTLAQVMACCLTAPSHYLNQCWLIISKVLWHSSEGIIMRKFEDTNQ